MQKVLKCFRAACCVRQYAKKANDMKYLNVAEKNDAAKTIANLLSHGAARRREGYSVYNKIYDFDASVRGQNAKMVMTSVSGHLMQLGFLVSYRNWRSVDPASLFDAPITKSVGDDYKAIKRTLEREVRGCGGLIIWTDCDREGENIGYEIIDVCRAIKPNLTVYRANFSEITTAAVSRALQQLGQPDKRQSDAVDVRTELDLRTGAAITRFQTMRLQRLFPENIAGKLISYGSCQIPTLGFVVERYKEIEAFVSEPFWKIKVLHTIDDLTVEFNWARNRLFDKEACENYLLLCLAEPRATVENVTVKPKHKWRPAAMDTVELEKLGSRKLKLSAKETMTIAEKLYSKGFISYPRTETNQFSKEFQLAPLVEQQTGHDIWGAFAQRVLEWGPNPRNGNKSDQAHPPIHPTKLVTNLGGNEARVYELIVRHFLACVSKDAVGSETIVSIDIAGEKFSANGLVIYERNYLDVYVYENWNAKQIHHYEQGQVFEPTEISLHEGATTAPPLLTEADLIALMDKHGIGTDATHAEHINTIKERGYIGVIDKGAIVPGVIGMALCEGYDAMELALAKPVLRAEFEADLKLICQGQKNPKLVLSEQIRKYKEAYQQIMDKIAAMDEKMAVRINETPTVNGDAQAHVEAPALQFLQQCPKCNVAHLALKVKKNQAGHYLGCLNFPDCKNVVWLPDECKEPSVLEECCERCGAGFKLLKFKLSTAYYRNMFNAPHGWYKTCLRCDGQFRSTFNINLDSVKRVGGIVGEPRSQPTGRAAQPPPPPPRSNQNNGRTKPANGGGGSETQQKPKLCTRTSSNTGQRGSAGDLRSYFTASSSRNDDMASSSASASTAALDNFFDSNDDDGFEKQMLVAAAAAESNVVANDFDEDIAAAFAADDDADFEALVNAGSGGQPPPSPPGGGAQAATIGTSLDVADDLDCSLTSWMRQVRENTEQPMLWGSKQHAAAAAQAPAPKRACLDLNWPRNDEAYASVLCSGCHQPARQQNVRRDGPNKGRPFYKCPKPNECKFFQWADEEAHPSTSASTAATGSNWGGASSASNSHFNVSKASNNAGNADVQCTCGKQAIILTVRRDGPNKGRQFYKCSEPNACQFFQWADESGNDGGGAATAPPSRAATFKASSTSATTATWGSSTFAASANREARTTSSSNAVRSNSNGTVTIAPTAMNSGGDVQCKCGKPASRLTVRKDGPNQGRPFYACAVRDQSCGFFQWGDIDENQPQSRSAPTANTGHMSWGSSSSASAPAHQQNRGNGSGNASSSSATASGSSRARRCGLCRQEGHTKNKCPRKDEFQY